MPAVRQWSEMQKRWHLTPILALSGAVLLLIAGLAITFYNEELYRAQMLRETGVQAEILAGSVAAALVFSDRGTADEYVGALKLNPEVDAAAVYNAAGKPFAVFARAGSPPLPVHPQFQEAAYAGSRLSITVPVNSNGSTVGSVYLRMAAESTARRFARYAGILLLAIMGALVLGVLGTAQTALTRANNTLSSQARDLEQANSRLQAEMAERARTEEELRQSQKMEAIGQLSGGIAHDFNNLLTIIKGNLQLIERRIGQGRSDVGRYLGAATEGLNRAASLTQRILAFSRRQPLSPKPVDLSVLVRGMSELLRHSVGESVAIETHLAAQGWTLCDANQMENVILNLAINARDAMPDGGRLVLDTADVAIGAAQATAFEIAAGDYVRLNVSDTGTGMSEEVRQKAIDPFFTTKPQGHGTGLGLSMTFGYVRQSGGHFTIDSEIGKGTTITILMPRAARGEEPATESAHGDDSGNQAGAERLA